MQPDMPRPTGLMPTLRHVMIAILWSAVLLAASRSLVGWGILGYRVDFDCLMVPLIAGTYSVPLLALMVWAFDRPGPVRAWYRSSCMAAGGIVAGVCFLLQDPVCFALTRHPSMTFPLSPLLSLICLWSGAKQMQLIWPGRCPGCGRRGLIVDTRPGRLDLRKKRSGFQAGWCAACGASYERQGRAAWRPPAVEASLLEDEQIQSAST